MAHHAIDISALNRSQSGSTQAAQNSLQVKGLQLYYNDDVQALHDINLDIQKRRVTAFIGPSGCGKSSLLRCFNRMNDLVDGCSVEGKNSAGGGEYLCPGSGSCRAASTYWHGVPETQPVPKIHL